MNNTVLIADDSKFYCKVLKKYVENLGFKTIICNDGESAIKEFYNFSDIISTVFLDIYMPKIDGISVLGQMRSKHPKLNIIVITSSEDPEFKSNAENYNALFLSKPFDLEKIDNDLKNILGYSE